MKFETENIFYKYGKKQQKKIHYSLKIRYSHVRYIQQF